MCGFAGAFDSRGWENCGAVRDNRTDIALLRKSLEDAVKRQLTRNVPYGVLLSVGPDSPVIAAMRAESGNTQGAWRPRLHSFAAGRKGAPGIAAARKARGYC